MSSPESPKPPEKKGRSLFHLLGSIVVGAAAALFFVDHTSIFRGPKH
jgi:hypothetical protein